MTVDVSTTNYEFAHGKKPRGYGYWAFYFGSDPEPHFYTGSYGEAKKAAVADAVAKGHPFVAVGS
jgi:hypothetical protein